MENIQTEQVSQMTIKEVCQHFNTNIENGLTWNQAQHRLQTFGTNDFIVKQEESLLSKYIEQFKNPLIILLLCSAFVSVCMQQFDDAFSITAAIMIVVTVAFVQEYRSEKSLDELNKLVPPLCRCLRDGKIVIFLAKNLVPGDIVLLDTGDRVPADIRLIESIDLQVDESNFTGETEPSQKTIDPIVPITKPTSSSSSFVTANNLSSLNNNDNTNDQSQQQCKNINNNNYSNMVFMGTLVCYGKGKGIVVNTGIKSEFGEIFKLMQSEEAPKTPLQKNMNILGKQLSFYSFGIIFIIMILGWMQGRAILEMFNIGVSLAVAAIPEGLPIVVTVTLALGVVRMAGHDAVIKRLPTVETLGCVNVICSDKTGTLTKNQMTINYLCTSDGFQAKLTGAGYNNFGELLLEENTTDQAYLAKQLRAFKRMLLVGCICNNSEFHLNESTNEFITYGQSTEIAILVAAKKLHLSYMREQIVRLDETPFSSKNKYMAIKARRSTILDTHDDDQTILDDFFQSNNDNDGKYFVKGAPEIILSKCKKYLYFSEKYSLNKTKLEEFEFESKKLGEKGFRVLAFAFGSDIDDLTYLGMVGLHDPPRPGAREAILALHRSSVDVKMLTGDSKETACSIGRKLSMKIEHSFSGDDIDKTSDEDFINLVKSITIFYRVGPSHKLKIVKALQANGLIVGMTGDGVNDGVALKKADIGIAMGQNSTDFCKEAADMILVKDDFFTIMLAIEEGKTIFYNIRNFIRFQLSTSIAALSLIAISTLMYMPNPLNAMQILWINIIMDGPPAQSLGVEPLDPDIIQQPPRNVKEPMINKELIKNVLISSTIIVIGTLIVFMGEMADNVVTPRDTTMTFTCFVFFDMFNALGCRSQTKSIFRIGLFKNRPFLFSVLFSLIGQFLVIYVPFFQRIFDTEALSICDLFYLLCISSTVFIASELKKLKDRSFNRKTKYNQLNFFKNNLNNIDIDDEKQLLINTFPEDSMHIV